ncbi:hypothetical protein BMS3Abin04_02893 [bacterium BMS3Abin04]|nr:hypothetical protein BMS3Abin04_02893 [bacterium BMS3Abin04]
MNFLIAIILSMILLIYVIVPLTENKYKLAFVPFVKKNKKIKNLQKRKHELLGVLKEIEFEYQMGKLSEQDYNDLKNDYQTNVLKILKELDRKTNDKSEIDDIENEIRKYRSKKKNGSASAKNFKYCPNCGKTVNTKSEFCTNCGKSLV